MAETLEQTTAKPPTHGQLALLQRIPDNDRLELGKGTWKVPIKDCFTHEHHLEEQARIFERLPLPVAPSGLLPEDGSFVCRQVYGQDIIITRDRSGRVRAFLNVCMHRGSRIVTDDQTQKKRLLTCPFHAWSYDLEGRLIGVPRQETFDDLEKSNFGLKELQCRELGGIIWLKPTLDADDDFSTIPAELVDDFDALGVPTMHLFATGVHDVASNWKLVMDTFQEGYHVTRLHSETLKGRFEDTIEVVDLIGFHMRRAAGRIGYRRDQLVGKESSLKDLRRLVTFHYTLFPNAVLICSQIYVSFMIFIPTGDKTCRVINYMLTDHPPQTDKDLDRFTRSHAMTDGSTFLEDFAAAEYGQVGISTGALEEFTLGSLERHVWTFHQILDAVMDGREIPKDLVSDIAQEA